MNLFFFKFVVCLKKHQRAVADEDKTGLILNAIELAVVELVVEHLSNTRDNLATIGAKLGT